jgi:hypothetical protein
MKELRSRVVNTRRVVKKIRRILPKLGLSAKMSTSLSDNQIYPQVCLDAANNYRCFNKFRRNPVYNEILEHVSEQQGSLYLDVIRQQPELLANIDLFRQNDLHGNPRICHYADVGAISPSTLRYVKVLGDLASLFTTLDGLNIGEIGVGYGGQCRVISAQFLPSSYHLVDIKPALLLAQRYLDQYAIRSTLSYLTMNELPKTTYDMIISNYAFTELPRAIQDIYLEKMILNSQRGYITYNDINPSRFRSYKKHELLAMLPGSHILDEVPLTHPNNCIIVWGDS